MELDYTQLSLFGLCPARYKYTYRDQIKHTMGNAAQWSSEIIHPCLANWYTDKETDWDKLWSKYSEVATDPGGDVYTLDKAKTLYKEYVERFISDKEEFEVLTSEVTGSTPVGPVEALPNDGRFISKPDLLLRERATGKVGSADFKVSKYNIQADLLPFDRQFLGQARLSGAEFMLKMHIQVLKTKIVFNRSYQVVNKELLDEWEAELLQEYKWVEDCERTDIWPKHSPDACYAYFTPCPYIGICNAGVLRQKVIDSAEKADSFGYLKG